MNLTRRNILKALGIGAAVSVSGTSIAKERRVNIKPDFMGNKLYCADNVEYAKGDIVLGSDGKKYQSLHSSNGGSCLNYYNSWKPV